MRMWRWLAAVGLAAIGRDGLAPLLRACRREPTNTGCCKGAHHVCYSLAHKGFGLKLGPVLAAIDGAEPGVAVPVAVLAALKALKQ